MRRAGVSIAALLVACSFDAVTDSGPNLEAGEASTTEAAASSSSTSAGATTGAQSGSAEGPATTQPDDGSGSPESTASTTDSAAESGDETAGAGEESTGSPVDCTVPVTISRLAAEAELFPPMMLGEYMGVPYAYSEQANAGAASFTYELECPSMYRLYARVRDDDPGTNSCCDPDSFVVEGPDGLDVNWFYGCDTQTAGWNWVQLEAGVLGGSCDEPTPIVISLSPGVHEFTLRNRESNYFEARAGIAELILTNDPAFSP